MYTLAWRAVVEQTVRIVKVFSATISRERERLGERVTEWLHDNPAIQVLDTMVRLSSDSAFHCLSIVLFCDADGIAGP